MTTTVHGWIWRSLQLLKTMRKLGTEEHAPKLEEPLDNSKDIMELWSSTDLIIYTYNTIHWRKLANSRKANFLTWGKAFKQAFMSIGYSWSCTTPLLVWNSWIIPPTAEDVYQSIWVGWYVVSKSTCLSTHTNLSTLMVLVWPTQDISLFVHSAKYQHLISTSNCAQSLYYLPLFYPTTYLAVYTKNTSVFICILQELSLYQCFILRTNLHLQTAKFYSQRHRSRMESQANDQHRKKVQRWHIFLLSLKMETPHALHSFQGAVTVFTVIAV